MSEATEPDGATDSADATVPDDVWSDWRDAVNIPRAQLERWLETDESRSVGDTGDASSTGHRSGERIVRILAKKKGELTQSDLEWMRKVIGYVHRHLAQRPKGDVTETKWRYSLMNWGHDPKKT